MRGYLVEVEGAGLQIPDGPIGFIINKFVFAPSQADAERRALRQTLRVWTSGRWAGVSEKPPQLTVSQVTEVGLIAVLRGWRRSRAHAFFDEDH